MELIPFTDLIAALGKVAIALKAIVYLPKAERKKYRQTMDETDRLIDATPNTVVIWPGEMLLQDADEDFLREAAQREFRLICSLQVALCNIVMNSGQDRRIDPVSLLREQAAWRGKIGATEMDRTITSEEE